MTLIIGIEDPQQGRAIVFADSGVWRDDNRSEVMVAPKIWRCHDWIVGASGSTGSTQEVERHKLPEFETPPTPAQIWNAVSDWSRPVMRAIGEMNAAIRAACSERSPGTPDILIAYGAYVFHVYEQSVMRTTACYKAIGMWTYADGALSALSDKPPFQQGERAMLAVEEILDSVRGPFRWLATDGSEGEF